MHTITFRNSKYKFNKGEYTDLDCWLDEMTDILKCDVTSKLITCKEYRKLDNDLICKYEKACISI